MLLWNTKMQEVDGQIMKNRKFLILMTVVMALALVLTGCGGKKEEPKKAAPKAAEKLKVAFVYVGPVGDAGWTYAHDQARKYLESKMPDVQTVFVESVRRALTPSV